MAVIGVPVFGPAIVRQKAGLKTGTANAPRMYGEASSSKPRINTAPMRSRGGGGEWRGSADACPQITLLRIPRQPVLRA